MERRSPEDPRRAEIPAAGVERAGGGEEDWVLARDGDTRAFERLYRAHAARVHSLARRMVGEAVADDLTQEVFIRAWQKLASFRGDAAFGTWLHRLAVNLILSRRKVLRSRQSRRVDDAGALERHETRGRRTDIAMDLEGALERLPDGARQVFVLYDVEGYSHKEIASKLGISVGTSKSQLHRARMLLRERLA